MIYIFSNSIAHPVRFHIPNTKFAGVLPLKKYMQPLRWNEHSIKQQIPQVLIMLPWFTTSFNTNRSRGRVRWVEGLDSFGLRTKYAL